MSEGDRRPVHYAPTRYVPSKRRRSTPAPAPRAQKMSRGEILGWIALGILVAFAIGTWLRSF